jgi:hypothetical protein
MRYAVVLGGLIGGGLIGACLAGPAAAYEFKLQYELPANARGVHIAGYRFTNGHVAGDCSYYTVTSGSGRDPRSYTTHFYQNCTWDLTGAFLSVAPGEPTAPTPLSSVNGLTIYARNARGDTTGTDTAIGGGFVNHASPAYAWVTPGGGYVFRTDQSKFQISLTIRNVGDLPLIVTKFAPTAYYAKVSVKSTTCPYPTPVAAGATCTAVITYDPSAIPGGDNPYTAYDHVTVGVFSNSVVKPTWSETIEVPIPPAD